MKAARSIHETSKKSLNFQLLTRFKNDLGKSDQNHFLTDSNRLCLPQELCKTNSLKISVLFNHSYFDKSTLELPD